MHERQAGGTATGVAVLDKIVLGGTHSPDCEDDETSEHMGSRANGVVVSHPIRMRRALISIPSMSIYAASQLCSGKDVVRSGVATCH